MDSTRTSAELPDRAWRSEKAQRPGLANAAAGRPLTTADEFHFGPISSQFIPPNSETKQGIEPGKGVVSGATFSDRHELRQWGVHLPVVPGIAGQQQRGAQSIVVAGGYGSENPSLAVRLVECLESTPVVANFTTKLGTLSMACLRYTDGLDHLEWLIYTGSGGRDLTGNRRTCRVQTGDQSFKRGNLALLRCLSGGLPVRLTRKIKEKKRCPITGRLRRSCFLRYDGIYRVERAWQQSGQQGHVVCQFLLVRVDNEPATWLSGNGPGRHERSWALPAEALAEVAKKEGEVYSMTQKPCWDWDDELQIWRMFEDRMPASCRKHSTNHRSGKPIAQQADPGPAQDDADMVDGQEGGTAGIAAPDGDRRDGCDLEGSMGDDCSEGAPVDGSGNDHEDDDDDDDDHDYNDTKDPDYDDYEDDDDDDDGGDDDSAHEGDADYMAKARDTFGRQCKRQKLQSRGFIPQQEAPAAAEDAGGVPAAQQQHVMVSEQHPGASSSSSKQQGSCSLKDGLDVQAQQGLPAHEDDSEDDVASRAPRRFVVEESDDEDAAMGHSPANTSCHESELHDDPGTREACGGLIGLQATSTKSMAEPVCQRNEVSSALEPSTAAGTLRLENDQAGPSNAAVPATANGPPAGMPADTAHAGPSQIPAPGPAALAPFDEDEEPLDSAVNFAIESIRRRAMKDSWRRLQLLDPSGRLVTSMTQRMIVHQRETRRAIELRRQGLSSNYKPRPLMFGGRCQAGKTIVNQLAGALCNHLMMPCFNITKGTSNQRDLFAKTSAGLRGVRVDMTRPGEAYMLEMEQELKILEQTQVAAGTCSQLEDVLACVCRLQMLKNNSSCMDWVLVVDESDSLHASLNSDRYKYERTLEALKGRGEGVKHRRDPDHVLLPHPPFLICVTATTLPTICQLEDQGYSIQADDIITIRGSPDYMGIDSYVVLKNDAGEEQYLVDKELSFKNCGWDSNGKVELMLLRNACPNGHVLHIANPRVIAPGGMVEFTQKLHSHPVLSAKRYTTIVMSASQLWVRYAGAPEEDTIKYKLSKGKHASIEDTATYIREEVCRQIGSDPLCELWYSAGFRGISGRIGDYRSPTGIICAIGPGFGLMQNVQAMCRACGDVRTLLRKANRSAIDFLGIQEDFLGVKKYFAFGDRLEARMRSHNEDSKTARRHMSITEDVDIFLPQCGRTGRRLEPGMTPVQAGIGPVEGENRDRDEAMARKQRTIQVSAVPAYAKCLHLTENLSTPAEVMAYDGLAERGTELITDAEIIDLNDLLEEAMHCTQGLQDPALEGDMAAGASLEDSPESDEVAGMTEDTEASLRRVGQYTVGARQAGPLYAAISSHCSLQPGQRIGQVETYRSTKMKKDPRVEALGNRSRNWCDVYFRPIADENARGGFKILLVHYLLSKDPLQEARARKIAYHAIHTHENRENLSTICFQHKPTLMLIEAPAIPMLAEEDGDVDQA